MKDCKTCTHYGNYDCFACHDKAWYKRITNAERIRRMTDEELSLFLETATESERVSETEWLKWLKGAAQI